MGIRQTWRDHKMLRELRKAVAEEVSFALENGRHDDLAHIRRETKHALRGQLNNLVARAVQEQIPESQHYAEIRDEVIDQLNRWPALKSDQEMREKVARTILESFMKVR